MSKRGNDQVSVGTAAPEVAGAATSNASSAKPPLNPAPAPAPVARKPYRRTKRPKNYNDKSTVTHVSVPNHNNKNSSKNNNHTAPNVYDAVLQECQDLLRAAGEAQALGRLKMAAAYSLLLHARLVGLGKRFDRSIVEELPNEETNNSNNNYETHGGDTSVEKATQGTTSPSNKTQEEQEQMVEEANNHQANSKKNVSSSTKDQQAASSSNSDTQGELVAKANAAAGDRSSTVVGDQKKDDHDAPATAAPVVALPAVALEQLSSILPSEVQLDGDMMEHLARAAVELHHQRTGRKVAPDGLLASPPQSGLMSLNMNGGAAPAPATTTSTANAKKGTAKTETATTATTQSKIAWTPHEVAIVEQHRNDKSSDNDNDKKMMTPSQLAELLPTKTEAQVKAYLKNTTSRKRGKAHVEQDILLLDDNTSATGTGTSTTGSSSQQHKGRGRKPPTTAMNTMPHANLDARSLLRKK